MAPSSFFSNAGFAAEKNENLKPDLVKAYNEYVKSIKARDTNYLKGIMPEENYRKMMATPKEDLERAFSELEWMAEDIKKLTFIHLESTDTAAQYYSYKIIKSKGEKWIEAGFSQVRILTGH